MDKPRQTFPNMRNALQHQIAGNPILRYTPQGAFQRRLDGGGRRQMLQLIFTSRYYSGSCCRRRLSIVFFPELADVMRVGGVGGVHERDRMPEERPEVRPRHNVVGKGIVRQNWIFVLPDNDIRKGRIDFGRQENANHGGCRRRKLLGRSIICTEPGVLGR